MIMYKKCMGIGKWFVLFVLEKKIFYIFVYNLCIIINRKKDIERDKDMGEGR